MKPTYRWLNPPPVAAQRIKDRRAAMAKLRRCKNYNAPFEFINGKATLGIR